MEETKQISSYYKETILKLIEKYKIVIDQCLKVIEDPIDSDLKDDKLHAVLKAKRQASEDAKFYAKEIDSLEDELSGKETSVTETVTERSWTKRKAN